MKKTILIFYLLFVAANLSSCNKGAKSLRELCVSFTKILGNDSKLDKLILNEKMIVAHYKENLSIEYGGPEKAEIEGKKIATSIITNIRADNQKLFKHLQTKGFDMKKLKATEINERLKGKNDTYKTADIDYIITDDNLKEKVSFKAISYNNHWFMLQELKPVD
jgi:hypothetical protein